MCVWECVCAIVQNAPCVIKTCPTVMVCGSLSESVRAQLEGRCFSCQVEMRVKACSDLRVAQQTESA